MLQIEIEAGERFFCLDQLVGSRNVIATLVLRESADVHSDLGSDLSLRKASSGACGADIPASSLLKSIRSSLETFFCLSNFIMNSFTSLSIK